MQALLFCEKLLLWFVAYSMLGWTYESILVSVQQRRWVNRGFLNGPLCPIYGTGAVLCILAFSSVSNPVMLFFGCALGASVLEYVTSWAMEKLFHARWWDYSNFRFNIQGRVCLIGAIIFGLGGVLITLVIQPYVALWTTMMPRPMLHWITGIALILLFIDLTITVLGVLHIEDTVSSFSAALQEYATRAGETWQSGKDTVSGRIRELSESRQEIVLRLQRTVTKFLNGQQRRMINSFPHFKLKSSRYNSVLDAIRELLRRKK